MQIISNKNRNKWASFLIITGVLAVWLTVAYVAHPNPMGGGGYLDFQLMFERLNLADLYNYLFPEASYYQAKNKGLDITAIYFFINSFSTILLGIFLKLKKIKAYTITSILLFASVIIGWPFPQVFSSVFFGLMSLQYGGPLIIPMFHIAVIGSFISAIKRLKGKTIYQGSNDTLYENKEYAQGLNDTDLKTGMSFKKSKTVLVIAYSAIGVSMIFGMPNFIMPLIFRPLSIFTEPLRFIFIIGLVSAIIAIVTKKEKVYRFAKLAVFTFTIFAIISMTALFFINI